MKILFRFFNSRQFECVTHRLGAYLLLLLNIVMPLGLHRPWMKLSGWWLFPAAFTLSSIGGVAYLTFHNSLWSVLAWPFPLLLTHDAWLLTKTPTPEAILQKCEKGRSE